MSRARKCVLAAYMACAVLLQLAAIYVPGLRVPGVWEPLEIAAFLCYTLVILVEDGG